MVSPYLGFYEFGEVATALMVWYSLHQQMVFAGFIMFLLLVLSEPLVHNPLQGIRMPIAPIWNRLQAIKHTIYQKMAMKMMGVTHELWLGSDRSFSCIKGKKISVSYKI
jgi:hypothetical protein